MSQEMTRRGFLASAAAGSLAAGTPGLAGAQTPKRGGKVNLGLQILPVGLDVARYMGLYAQWVISFTHDGLVDIVPPSVIKAHLAAGKSPDDLPVVTPNLAENWEISKDGLTYTFNLQKGVSFHNGQELTSDDVKFCIERIRSKPIGSTIKPRFELVREMALPDKHTIRFVLKEPFAPFISYLSYKLPIYPRGSAPMDQLIRKFDEKQPPLPGTGPFKWVDYKPGDFIQLERFDGYRFEGQPYLDEVKLNAVMDPTVRFTALRTGELDYISGVPSSAVAQEFGAAQPKGDVTFDKGEYMIYVNDPNIVQALALNTSQPPFNDIRVRRAIQLGIDRGQVAVGSTMGLGYPMIQPYTQDSTAFFIDGLSYPAQNQAQARQLLKDAGHGKGLTITIMMLNTNQVGLKAAQVMQQQLKGIGVNLKIEMFQKAAYFAKAQQGNFEMTTRGIGSYYEYDLDMLYTMFYSYAKDQNYRNYAHYSNEAVDEALDKARRLQELGARKKQYRKVYEAMIEDVTYIPLTSSLTAQGWRSRLKGFDPRATIPDLRAFSQVWIG